MTVFLFNFNFKVSIGKKSRIQRKLSYAFLKCSVSGIEGLWCVKRTKAQTDIIISCSEELRAEKQLSL